jgi:hypothetical protein
MPLAIRLLRVGAIDWDATPSAWAISAEEI